MSLRNSPHARRRLEFIRPAILSALAPLAPAQDGLVAELPPSGNAISSNGRFVTGGLAFSNLAYVYDLERGVRSIAASEGLPLAVSDDGKTVLFEFGIWTESNGYAPVAGPAGSRHHDMSADGRYLLMFEAGANQGSFIVDRETGTRVRLDGPGSPECISGDGSTVGGKVWNPPGVWEATIWDAASGAMTVIDPGTSFDGGTVLALSFDGRWATGELVEGGSGIRAFRWSVATGFEALPPFSAPGGVAGGGVWISADGSALMSRFFPPGSPFEVDSMVWEEGSGPVSMETWLLREGLVEPPFPVGHSALDVSEDGRSLVLITLQGPSPAFVRLDARVSDSYCGPATPNSNGAPAQLRLLGSNAFEGDLLRLRATHLPPAQPLLAAASRSADFLPGAGGSAGALCLGGAIGRFPVGEANDAGLYELDLDSAALPQPNGTVAAVAGEAWHFQVWFRDPLGGGSNFTDGARLTFQ